MTANGNGEAVALRRKKRRGESGGGNDLVEKESVGVMVVGEATVPSHPAPALARFSATAPQLATSQT